MENKQVWKIGDCLELLPGIPDKSIDMILTDLPYGTTACSWDVVIPFEPLWKEYKRIIKDNGAIILTAAQPFTSALIMSNIEMFKYDLIWHHGCVRGFLNANRMPLRDHECICVFYKKLPVYNPQKYKRGTRRERKMTNIPNMEVYGKHNPSECCVHPTDRFPTSVIEIRGMVNNSNEKADHSTQKPVSLFEYLIKTYTNEGDIVHDSCLGSGTTLEACMNTNRNCIGFEISNEWVSHYRKRLKSDNSKLTDTWDSGNMVKVA